MRVNDTINNFKMIYIAHSVSIFRCCLSHFSLKSAVLKAWNTFCNFLIALGTKHCFFLSSVKLKGND